MASSSKASDLRLKSKDLGDRTHTNVPSLSRRRRVSRDACTSRHASRPNARPASSIMIHSELSFANKNSSAFPAVPMSGLSCSSTQGKPFRIVSVRSSDPPTRGYLTTGTSAWSEIGDHSRNGSAFKVRRATSIPPPSLSLFENLSERLDHIRTEVWWRVISGLPWTKQPSWMRRREASSAIRSICCWLIATFNANFKKRIAKTHWAKIVPRY